MIITFGCVNVSHGYSVVVSAASLRHIIAVVVVAAVVVVVLFVVVMVNVIVVDEERVVVSEHIMRACLTRLRGSLHMDVILRGEWSGTR